MHLDRRYTPRRRRNHHILWWPLVILGVAAVVLYEQQPAWLSPQQLQPTPTATRNIGSFLMEARSLATLSEFDGALQAYQEAARLEPENPEPLVAQSRIYMILQDIDAAQRLAEEAVAVAPDDPDALGALARALDWQGQYEAAINYGLDGLEIEPDNVTLLAILGEIYTDVGNWSIAEEYLNQAMQLDPQNVTMLRNMAYLNEIQGNYEAAIEFYQKAIEVAPNRFDLFIELGRQYRIGTEDFEKANESYKQAVDVYESPVTLDAYGFGLYNIGDHLQAIRVLRHATEMDPRYGPAQVHLGMALYARRNYEDAIPALLTGIRLLGDKARIEHVYTLGLAYIYQEPSDCESAIPWLQRALEMHPESLPVLEGLRVCNAR